ncbi:GNAT family N-acetyltransferase [Candidatus Woesearchaeota archaeon]|nr:GNAT family N-acetyltransferase [Candidatus Woesearchaeota archaeon]
MDIRKATKKDAEGIALVLKESYNIDSIEEGKEVFSEELRKGYNFIAAEHNGKIVGLTSWIVHGLPKHGLAELDRIAVLPDFKGKGVAQQLFDGLVKDADAEYRKKKSMLRKLYILCHASNKRAHKFYEKMGLKHETTLKKHYYDNEDEWVYSKFFQ